MFPLRRSNTVVKDVFEHTFWCTDRNIFLVEMIYGVNPCLVLKKQVGVEKSEFPTAASLKGVESDPTAKRLWRTLGGDFGR